MRPPTCPPPDRYMWLIPEAVRESLRTGFTVGFGYPRREHVSAEALPEQDPWADTVDPHEDPA